MQFIPNALRFSPASVGALIDPAFLRSVLRDAEAPTHPDAALAAAAQAGAHAKHWYAPLAAAGLLVLQWSARHWPSAGDW